MTFVLNSSFSFQRIGDTFFAKKAFRDSKTGVYYDWYCKGVSENHPFDIKKILTDYSQLLEQLASLKTQEISFLYLPPERVEARQKKEVLSLNQQTEALALKIFKTLLPLSNSSMTQPAEAASAAAPIVAQPEEPLERAAPPLEFPPASGACLAQSSPVAEPPFPIHSLPLQPASRPSPRLSIAPPFSSQPPLLTPRLLPSPPPSPLPLMALSHFVEERCKAYLRLSSSQVREVHVLRNKLRRFLEGNFPADEQDLHLFFLRMAHRLGRAIQQGRVFVGERHWDEAQVERYYQTYRRGKADASREDYIAFEAVHYLLRSIRGEALDLQLQVKGREEEESALIESCPLPRQREGFALKNFLLKEVAQSLEVDDA